MKFWPLVVLSVIGFTDYYQISAQQVVPSVAWERLHNESSPPVHDVFTLAQTSDGGYIVGGRFYGAQAGADCILIKIDSEGEIQWEKTYGGSGNDVVRFVREASDGGYIFAATSTSPVSGNKEASHFGGEDVWVVKVDAQGNKQWERSFGGAGDDSPAGFWQVPDGYLLATKATTVSGDGGFC